MARSLTGGFADAFLRAYTMAQQMEQEKSSRAAQEKQAEEAAKRAERQLALAEQEFGERKKEGASRRAADWTEAAAAIFGNLGFGGKTITTDQAQDNARQAVAALQGQWNKLLDEGMPPKKAMPVLKSFAKQMGYSEFITPEVEKAWAEGAATPTLLGKRVPKTREKTGPGAAVPAVGALAAPIAGLLAPGIFQALSGAPMTAPYAEQVPESERMAAALELPTEAYAQGVAKTEALTRLTGERQEQVEANTELIRARTQAIQDSAALKQELGELQKEYLKARTVSTGAMMQLRQGAERFRQRIATQKLQLERSRLSNDTARTQLARERYNKSLQEGGNTRSYIHKRLPHLETELRQLQKMETSQEALLAKSNTILQTLQGVDPILAGRALTDAKGDQAAANRALVDIRKRKSEVTGAIRDAKSVLDLLPGQAPTNAAGKPQARPTPGVTNAEKAFRYKWGL